MLKVINGYFQILSECTWKKSLQYVLYNLDTHQKTTSNNTKAFVHMANLENFFSCALMWFAWKFESEVLAETPQTKRKE